MRRADLTTFVPIVSKSGSLNILEPSGRVKGLYRDCFTFYPKKRFFSTAQNLTHPEANFQHLLYRTSHTKKEISNTYHIELNTPRKELPVSIAKPKSRKKSAVYTVENIT